MSTYNFKLDPGDQVYYICDDHVYPYVVKSVTIYGKYAYPHYTIVGERECDYFDSAHIFSIREDEIDREKGPFFSCPDTLKQELERRKNNSE